MAIQCDNTKPVCDRCIRLGKQCYGYQAAFSIINAEDIYASGQRKRPRGPRTIDTTQVTIHTGLPRNLKLEAISYYMFYHVAPVDGMLNTDGVAAKASPPVWKTPTLELAMSSLSLAIFSKAKHSAESAREASINYHKSIRGLQTTLQHVNESNMDAYLLTVYFLQRYEDSIYSPSIHNGEGKPKQPGSLMHNNGIAAGLKHWFESRSTDDAPTGVIKHARRSVRKIALLGQVDFPAWLRDGAMFGEDGKDLELDRILVCLIGLRCRASSVLEDDESTRLDSQDDALTLQTLYQGLVLVDEALQEWLSSCPEYACYTKHVIADGQHGPEQDFFHSHVYVNQHHTDAIARVQIYGYRILANHPRCRLLQRIETKTGFAPQGKMFESRHIMNCLAYDLVSSIPFCLQQLVVSEAPGEFDHEITITRRHETTPYLADLVAMPVVIASTTSFISTEYREWLLAQLVKIGRTAGYGLLEHVASSSWFKL